MVLARFGLASRRGVVGLIESGKVQVNGRVVLEKGLRVDAAKDRIQVEGREFSAQAPEKLYYLFHKPKGVMTTLQDPHAEKTVADFYARWYRLRGADVRFLTAGKKLIDSRHEACSGQKSAGGVSCSMALRTQIVVEWVWFSS